MVNMHEGGSTPGHTSAVGLTQAVHVQHWQVTGEVNANPADILRAVRAALSGQHVLSKGSGSTIVVTEPVEGGQHLWVSEAAPPGGQGNFVLDFVGPANMAPAVAQTYAHSIGTRAVNLTATELDHAWLAREPARQLGSFSYIDAPAQKLTYGPWLRAVSDAVTDSRPRPVVIRTPGETTPSPIMRLLLATGWAVWIKYTAEGPVEGLTGIPVRVGSSGTIGFVEPDPGVTAAETEDISTRVLYRAGVLHARDGVQEIGVLSERLIEGVGGPGQLARARYGWSEVATAPFNRFAMQAEGARRSPQASMWCLDAGTLYGTVTFTPVPAGILEEVDIESSAVRDQAAVWDHIADLAPLVFTCVAGDVMAAHLEHESLQRRENAGRPQRPDSRDESNSDVTLPDPKQFDRGTLAAPPPGYRGFLRLD